MAHRGITSVFVMQNFYCPGKYVTTATKNAQYIVYFNQPRDLSVIRTLGLQIDPTRPKFLVDAYKKATSQKFGYLFIDLQPLTDQRYRVRGGPNLLKVILKAVGRDLREAISELVYNCIYGPVEFTSKQKAKLTPFKNKLRLLASKKKSIKLRRKILLKVAPKALEPIAEAVSHIFSGTSKHSRKAKHDMARRLARAEEDYLQRMKQKPQLDHKLNVKQEPFDSEDIKIYGVPPDAKDNMRALIELLPPRLRTKARLLIHYLKDLQIDSQGRVKYENGKTGSYLIDLVRFFASHKDMSPARPIDANMFASVLVENNVPLSALGAGRIADSSTRLDIGLTRGYKIVTKKVRWIKP